MCGIAFLLDRRITSHETSQRMRDCLGIMHHRGPDDARIEYAGEALLGHRRLSIIDLAGSKQPMVSPDRRYSLSYNGEIYNYVEVRKSLEGRWAFSTHGDTEVLLAGLIIEGERFLARLEGMWAFVLWDAEGKTLLLGRDRMGKKPLYYHYLNENGFACASELPALRRLTRDVWHEDVNSTADFLRYGFQMPGRTAWEEVYEILPGNIAEWKPGSVLNQKAWWKLEINQYAGNRSDASEELRGAMVSAVEKRLVADVEVGAFLSGGVDSSLISAIIRKNLGLHLKTFTVGFSDKSYDERVFARLVADKLSTEHYEGVLGEWDENELERLILGHFGQPFGDTSLLPTQLVSKLASDHVKVALSGDGSDELFCGYQRYQARMILRWFTRLPKPLRSNLNRLIRMIPEPAVHHSRSIIKKSHLFLDIIEKQESETPYFAPVQFTEQRLARIAPDIAGHGHAPTGLPETTELDELQKMMCADASIYLPQDILVKVDRASMSQSIEVRAPFLDHKVVELAFSMPSVWHRRQFRGKRMLQDAFGSLIPESVWARRKQGFGTPLHEWFRGDLGKRLRGWLIESPGPFDRAEVENFLDEHVSRKRDHGYRLWQIYVYLLWRRSCLEGL